MSNLTDAQLETKWRGLCDNKISRCADEKDFEACWFESCNRGMGETFMDIYQQMKEAHKSEQAAQLAFIANLGVPK